MTPKFHQGLTLEKWATVPLEKKILNIASELTRTKNLMRQNDEVLVRSSFERALELTDMTVETEAGHWSTHFLREFLRFREFLTALYTLPNQRSVELPQLLRNLIDLCPQVHNLQLVF